jgi:drug/metabolite transporter (DMT)-like permease
MKIGIVFALLSAVLFGASTPISKLLLKVTDPWLLAGLLYLGSGVGLGIVMIAERALNKRQARISRADFPWLVGAVIAGGVIGPVALMLGLARTTASSTALLLNLEGLATMGIAWVVFRENVDRRLLIGAGAILAGAIALAWQSGPTGIGPGPGALLIALACVAWGIDNNLTRKVSAASPIQIAAIKGLVAGPVNIALAALQGAAFPTTPTLAASALLGFLGYGISLALFVLALRHLGAARTGAYFSTAPFVGAILGIALLHEPLTVQLGLAAVLMAIGVWLHVTERHEHEHTHEPLTHDHAHTHDEHHTHEHAPGDPPGEPHAHLHRHQPLTHKHPHYPDLHHQHGH